MKSFVTSPVSQAILIRMYMVLKNGQFATARHVVEKKTRNYESFFTDMLC